MKIDLLKRLQLKNMGRVKCKELHFGTLEKVVAFHYEGCSLPVISVEDLFLSRASSH